MIRELTIGSGVRRRNSISGVFLINNKKIMRNETWQALDDIFFRTPVLKAEEVDCDEIEAAEREVGIVLADDYEEFVCRYGGAIVGPFRVFGLRKAIPMGRNGA